MMRPRRRFATGTLVGALLAARALAQSYGDQDQILTVGAAEFRPLVASDTYLDANGYLYGGSDIDYWAPLNLPEGAVIERVCLYADDSDPGGSVLTDVFAAKLVSVGEDPAFWIAAGSDASSSSNIGYGVYCSDSFSYTVRGSMDDGDGTPEPVAHYVYALVTGNSHNALGFGGVRITWRRQVSPTPSSPTFADVPASDIAFPYVEALAASGITSGCAGGNYCPDATLTRRQMAVFLAKALGLHWTDSAP